MGQRLNIEIIKGEKTQANAYYHWSAFTYPTLELGLKILDSLDKIEEEDDLLYAIKLLEETGALVQDSEIEGLKRRFKGREFEPAINRNEGLISYQEKGMSATRNWEEGRLEVNLDEKTISFDVYSTYTKEEYLEYLEESEEDYKNLPTFTKDYDDWMTFDEFRDFANECIKALENNSYAMKATNDVVVSFIA